MPKYFCIWYDTPSKLFHTLEACEDWAAKNVPHTHMRVCFYRYCAMTGVVLVCTQHVKKEGL